MSTLLTPGELAVNFYVTVLDWIEEEPEPEETNPLIFLMGRARRPVHLPLRGEVLRIKAIQLPYVFVHIPATDQNITLDTRLVRLMELSDEYVAAKLEKPLPNAVKRGVAIAVIDGSKVSQ